MSDLTIRSPNGQWVNICGSEWKVLQEDMTWKELDPLNDLRVRHGSNDYWLQVDCDRDAAYCPPEQLAKCWPGYSGNFDSSQFKVGGTTGYLVCDCDGLNCKTYTGHTPDYNVAAGRFTSTAPVVKDTAAYSLPTTLYGHEAQITEMLVHAGTRSGHIEVSILELDQRVRVRIYNDCTLLGDSNVSGNYFNVFFNTEPEELTEGECGDPIPANNFLTVRVDAQPGARWYVKLGEPNISQRTNFDRPAPCYGTFGPILPCFVNDDGNLLQHDVATYENVHYIPNSGKVDIDMTVTGTEPVYLEVIYAGVRVTQIWTANSKIAPHQANTLTFNHTVRGGDNYVIIRYIGPRQYNNWTYSIFCPGQVGSRINMKRCMSVATDVMCSPLNATLDPAHSVVGQGAHTSDVWYDYSGMPGGDIVVEYFATDPVQMVFYQGSFPNETLLAGTRDIVQGHNRFFFRFNPALGSVIRVQIVGPCCPDWAFTMGCPVAPTILNVPDAEIVRGRKGETSYLCFDVTLGNRTPRDVTFTWETSPLTAIVSMDGSCSVTETVTDSPFCNILATGTGVEAGSSNDTWIGYQCFRIRSSHHAPNCAVGGQYYVVETEIELPYDGAYTMVGSADDNMYVYLDCKQVMAKSTTWEYVQTTPITARAGWQTLSIMYQNVPNCTPGWAKLVILDGAGNVVFATNPNTHLWRSKVGGITVEPPPLPVTYVADYNFVQGSGIIPACTDSTRICVPVCGTDLMGPDVTFQLTLGNLQNAEPGKMTAIGTIKNQNSFSCDQNTQLAVDTNGLSPYVNRGAYQLFTSDLLTNGGATKVMDADIYIPASGLYTIYFHGMDNAHLYMDCQLLASNSGASGAVRTWTPMNVGMRKFYITYDTGASKTPRPAYAAMAILDSQNRVVYASHPANWRGRVMNEGTPPSCNQFPDTCNITPTGGCAQYGGDPGVGYGAVTIHSTLHPAQCAIGNQFYTLEQTLNFPVSGNYRFRGTGDDTIEIFVDCQSVFTALLGNIPESTVFVAAGAHKVTVSYKNVPHCTPGYVAFAIIKPDGQAMYASAPEGWVSAVGSLDGLPVPLHSTMYQNRWMTHISTSIAFGGPEYAWWSAERDINIPADGDYYVTGYADDAVEVFIGCQNRSIAGQLFRLKAGPQKMHIRCYNQKSKRPNYFWFTLFNSAGQVVYDSEATGWRGKWADLDFTGLS